MKAAFKINSLHRRLMLNIVKDMLMSRTVAELNLRLSEGNQRFSVENG